MFSNQRFVKAIGLAAILLLLTAAVVSAQFTPQVFAINQDVVDGVVNVTRATSDGDGWIVVSNADGEVLGSAAIPDGISATVPVEIDASGVAEGDTLTIALYSDDGDGAFDAALDTPVEVDGVPVSVEITATAVGSTLLATLGDGAFATFIAGIEGSDIGEELAEGGPYTVFAPSDEALAASTLPADAEAQTEFALGSIVPGIFTTDVLTQSQELATLAGTVLDVQVADDGSITVNGHNIVTPDGTAFNGVVQRIDGVLLPVVEEPMVEVPVAEAPDVEAGTVVTETATVTDTSVVTTTEAAATEAVATEVPAEEATAVATEEPTEEATPEATVAPAEEAAATEVPAEEATAAPTEEPTEEATPEATVAPAEEAAATEVPAEEATAAPAEEAAATEVPAEEATAAPAEEAAATEVPAEEATAAPAEEAAATEVPAEEATAAPAEEAAATEVPAEEATAAPAEEAAATEVPAEEATAAPAEEATAAPAAEVVATPAPAEEAPETLPATGVAATSPIALMVVSGLVLVGLAIFAVAFRRRPA